MPGNSPWIPSTAQGVKGFDDDDDGGDSASPSSEI